MIAPVNEMRCAHCGATYIGYRALCPLCLARWERWKAAARALAREPRPGRRRERSRRRAA